MSTAERSRAQTALAQLEASALAELKSHIAGLRTGEIAHLLGIESHCPTANSNWLARCVLENLVSQGRAVSKKLGSARVFSAL